MAMRREEQRFLVPIDFSLRLAFPAIRKSSVSAPLVDGPPVLFFENLVLVVIAGQHDPVRLPLTTGNAPIPDIICHGSGFFVVDLRVAVAFLRIIGRVQEHAAGATVVLPVATTYAGPVSADYPDPSQALRELAEPVIQAGSIGIPDIKRGNRIFFYERDLVDAVSSGCSECGPPADVGLVIEERDLVIDAFSVAEFWDLLVNSPTFTGYWGHLTKRMDTPLQGHLGPVLGEVLRYTPAIMG